MQKIKTKTGKEITIDFKDLKKEQLIEQLRTLLSVATKAGLDVKDFAKAADQAEQISVIQQLIEANVLPQETINKYKAFADELAALEKKVKDMLNIESEIEDYATFMAEKKEVIDAVKKEISDLEKYKEDELKAINDRVKLAYDQELISYKIKNGGIAEKYDAAIAKEPQYVSEIAELKGKLEKFETAKAEEIDTLKKELEAKKETAINSAVSRKEKELAADKKIVEIERDNYKAKFEDAEKKLAEKETKLQEAYEKMAQMATAAVTPVVQTNK